MPYIVRYEAPFSFSYNFDDVYGDIPLRGDSVGALLFLKVANFEFVSESRLNECNLLFTHPNRIHGPNGESLPLNVC
jgi:hypothetical protein